MTSTQGRTIVILDNKFGMASLANTDFWITHADTVIQEAYTVSFHAEDPSGAGISGLTVTWVDSQSNTGSDTTDVNGDVSFQLTARQFLGTAETETDFNDFTFTFSKAGLETLIMPAITIDSAIDWTVEMKPAHGTWSKPWR